MFSMRFSVSMAGPVARSKGFATLYAISCVIAYGQIRDKATRSFLREEAKTQHGRTGTIVCGIYYTGSAQNEARQSRVSTNEPRPSGRNGL